ncbi:penicillin acylase family protein [Streptomyces africanus]|uniref:penicillin acylase family protein n=1 Tax=Streptomyces africanus TaxID=231024 RepID=UPI001302CEF2|nr:penicillin acylase family protein [Streptomyces africanus]
MSRRDRLVRYGLSLAALPSRWAHTDRGSLRLPGLARGATIRRDERGVPWAESDNDVDLYFAAGFAQAQDRLWQMDVLRRRARGRLSEVFGAVTEQEDIRARKLALTRVARLSERLLGPEHRAALAAFSAGVNAAIRRMRRRGGLPVEFLLLRYGPDPWTPLDSILIVKYLGFDLAVNIKNEVFRARLASECPEYLPAFAEPRYPADGPVTVRGRGSTVSRGGAPLPPPAIGSLPRESRRWLDGLLDGEHPIGSNAWAVSGTLTASGHPILANDPHVPFTQPSLWYQMGLGITGRDEPGDLGYGVTVPGVPGLIAGANRRLAWGITNSTIDTQDLCVLPPDPDPAESWREDSAVTVRGKGSVTVRASGGHGYVELDPPASGTEARYGLFWSGFEPSVEIACCQSMWRADGPGDFRDVLRGFGVPVLNVIWACQDGTISVKTAGRVPARVAGSGRAPAEHAQAAASWKSFLDFDDLPEDTDPERGYVVSANHKMLPDDAPVDVGADWVAPYRAERIEELITTASAITAEACGTWQGDVSNGRARRVLPTLLTALDEAPPAAPLVAACHRLLADWDGHDHGHLAAPLVFFRLLQKLTDRWVYDRLGADLATAMPDITLQVDHLLTSPEARQRLGEDEPLPAVVGYALAEAAAWIAEEQGDNPAHWRYDLVHRVGDRHALARAVPGLSALFGGATTPVGGSGHSVCLMTPDRQGTVVEGAPWRFVAELRPDGPRLWDVLRHGSSGHPRSRHYKDQTPVHAAGRLYPVPLEGPTAGTARLLSLRPRRGGTA